MSKRQQLPWKREGRRIVGAAGRQIGELGVPGCRLAKLDEANGDLIVAAVNAHGAARDLLAVARDCRVFLAALRDYLVAVPRDDPYSVKTSAELIAEIDSVFARVDAEGIDGKGRT